MNILGISAYYHDSAACLVVDGKIVAAASEERFSRKKQDARFPKQAVMYCLKEGDISFKDIDYVAFYDKPFLKFERLLETYLSYAPTGIQSFLSAMPVWLKQKLWTKEIIRKELGYEGEILFPEHHLSHAASAFFPSPFKESAILTLDGVGEWATTSYGIGKGNHLEILRDIHFPHSLGLLYSSFTYYTGFKVNSGEYKLMGLAPYGEPTYVQLIKEHLIEIFDDGSFRLNMDYFNYPAGLTMTNEAFHTLFGGPPRSPETALRQKDMDLARSIQEITEEVMLAMARHIKLETGMKNICLAGGVALNCVANGKLLRSGLFDGLWIQPAAGDAGGALGAAMAVWHLFLEQPRTVQKSKDSMNGAYLGPSYSDKDILEYLERESISYSKLSTNDLCDVVADLLHNEQVVGWFQGRMEFGPRALGSRSILGDARSEKMQKIMNIKIKFRESFRPFAPSVLAEKVDQYFDLKEASPYMLLVADVKKSLLEKLSKTDAKKKGLEKLYVTRSQLPAITHVDNSARVQTVHKETNPLYHQMLSTFSKKHKCAVIINTSFNVRGEPIVCTPEDAYRCFMRTNMDYLVLGHYLLSKKEQPKIELDDSWKEEFELD